MLKLMKRNYLNVKLIYFYYRKYVYYIHIGISKISLKFIANKKKILEGGWGCEVIRHGRF